VPCRRVYTCGQTIYQEDICVPYLIAPLVSSYITHYIAILGRLTECRYSAYRLLPRQSLSPFPYNSLESLIFAAIPRFSRTAFQPVNRFVGGRNSEKSGGGFSHRILSRSAPAHRRPRHPISRILRPLDWASEGRFQDRRGELGRGAVERWR